MDKLMSMFQKFDEANQHVKQSYPDDWKERMRIFRLMITDNMSGNRQCVVEAAIVLASQYLENDNTRMWIHATAFEMIEEG
jgi:hypothetical protein